MRRPTNKQNGRSAIKRKVRFRRRKKKFTPKDGWAAQPRRSVHKSARSVRKAHNEARKARKTAGNAKVDMLPIEVEDVDMFSIIMAQLSLKQGMKEWGKERADESIMKEFQMLHDLNCFIPRDLTTLTREECMRALCTVVFMN